MISRDLKIIQNDMMQAEESRSVHLVKYKAILRERDIRCIGFQTFQSLHLKWLSRAWHLGMWVADGCVRIRHENGEFSIPAGDVLIVPAGLMRSIWMTSKPMSYFFVHFHDVTNWDALNRRQPFKLRSRNLSRMAALLPLLEEGMVSGDQDHTMSHLVRAFCDYAADDLTQQSDPHVQEIQNRLTRIWQMVYEQPAYVWTADVLAEEACFSKGHLHRSCKKIYGKGPMSMVTQIRLEQGAGLLMHSDDTTETIAHRVGFGSARAFSTAFLREYGKRPGKYRKDMG